MSGNVLPGRGTVCSVALPLCTVITGGGCRFAADERTVLVRIVVALGGNALLKRTDPMTAEAQRGNVRVAAQQLAPLALEHELVLAHGNGPQVGLLALQAAAYDAGNPYPLDVLGAGTEGMIGYMVEQELGNLLPFEKPIATLLTMVEIDPDDPAFDNPTKFVGPCYHHIAAERLCRGARLGLQAGRRRVAAGRRVARAQADLRAGSDHLAPREGRRRHLRRRRRDSDGVPAGRDAYARWRRSGHRQGPRKRAARAAARARTCSSWRPTRRASTETGEPRSRRSWTQVTPAELRNYTFAEGSMGPKVDAAARFVEATGKRAAIGCLSDIVRIVAGEAGTNVVADHSMAAPA